MRNPGVEILFDYPYSGRYGLISKTFLSKPIRLSKDSMSISFYWGLVVVIPSSCPFPLYQYRMHRYRI